MRGCDLPWKVKGIALTNTCPPRTRWLPQSNRALLAQNHTHLRGQLVGPHIVEVQCVQGVPACRECRYRSRRHPNAYSAELVALFPLVYLKHLQSRQARQWLQGVQATCMGRYVVCCAAPETGLQHHKRRRPCTISAGVPSRSPRCLAAHCYHHRDLP